MKRFLIVIVILLLIAAVVAGGLLWYTGRSGSTGVEQWVGRQLSAIANDALVPEFAFDSLDYEFPATATLRRLTLREGETTIIEAASAKVVLAERPRVGEPIVIESIELTDPAIRLIQQDDGSLVGFSNLVESVEGEVKPSGGSTRPSDVFAIRTIRIINGLIEYDTPGAEPMRLNDITFDLTSTPREADAKGWYVLDAVLERKPVFKLALDSRLNIDSKAIEFDETTLDMHLRENQYELLPPQIQTLIRRHEVRGDLVVRLTGRTTLNDPLAGELGLAARLSDGMISFDDYVLPVASLDLTADLKDQILLIRPLTIAALDGTIDVSGEAGLVDAMQASGRVDVKDVRIENALRHASDEPPNYKGRVVLGLNVASRLATPVESLSGDGTLEVTEGRFIELPILGGLIREISGAAKGGDDSRVSAGLELERNVIRFRDVDFVASTVVARGEGELMHDGSVNFRFNGGPLERAQKSLGAIGDIFGAITDQLVKYQVTGTLSKPEFNVRPLGFGTKSAPKANDQTAASEDEAESDEAD